MLNWEYDPEVEKRVIREEAREEGVEQLAKLIREGYTLDEALVLIKDAPSPPPQ